MADLLWGKISRLGFPGNRFRNERLAAAAKAGRTSRHNANKDQISTCPEADDMIRRGKAKPRTGSFVEGTEQVIGSEWTQVRTLQVV